MTSVLQLTRKLTQRPVLPEISGVTLRHYCGPPDIAVWLDLRRRAFARQKVGVRDWNTADFEREMLAKTWWKPEHLWFAETQLLLMPTTAVGTVVLARRGEGPEARPVVHWLAVAPSYRRRKTGRLLMSALEATVWAEGGRQVWLETHSGWSEAVQMYQALGYEPATE